VADSLAARERQRTSLATLPVLIAAAAVLSMFMAFAAALMDEMRSPRVADAVEAERLTNQRVLTVVGTRAIPADRARRAADRSIPPLLDPTADGYRILAWHITSRWPADGVITIAGDEPEVAAIIGANLAAVFAVDARATLLVDAELVEGPVQRVLKLPDSPGLAAVLENRRKWSEALVQVDVGRSRTIDVLPAGERARPIGPAETQALIALILRAARRHDATVVVSTSGDALRRRAGDDVILCATAGATRLATLARAVATLTDVGARVRGIVLWEGAPPVVERDDAA
jgi:tyrosine-protein kinase Etk/Wzc